MSKLVKFENCDIDVQNIDGVWVFELYSIGFALGYITKAKGKKYPYKERIDKIVKNAEITPVSQGVKLYLTEEMVYDFMLEARIEKCKAFDFLSSVLKKAELFALLFFFLYMCTNISSHFW